MTHTTHSLEEILADCHKTHCEVNAIPPECICGVATAIKAIDHYTTTKINEVLDAVEEAIGDVEHEYKTENPWEADQRHGKNKFRAELRQKLSQIRKEQS